MASKRDQNFGGWEYDNPKEKDPWDEHDWEELWSTFWLDGMGETLLYKLWFNHLWSNGSFADPIDEY